MERSRNPVKGSMHLRTAINPYNLSTNPAASRMIAARSVASSRASPSTAGPSRGLARSVVSCWIKKFQ